MVRGVLLIWIIVGQGPTALTVGAGGVLFGHFSLIYQFSLFSHSLLETARYRLKYCLKGPLRPKQPTTQSLSDGASQIYVYRLIRQWSSCFHKINNKTREISSLIRLYYDKMSYF